MSRTLKAGLVQQQAWPDKARSLAASEDGVRALAGQGAELVMLQELHWPGPASRRRTCWRRSTWTAASRSGATGPIYAIAASTPTAT